MQYIDPKKVLLIVNSDYPQSLADALDYVSRRGLTSTNILSFNLGTTTTITTDILDISGTNTTTPVRCNTSGTYWNQTFVTAISNFKNNNQVDGVILSTYTPHKLTGTSTYYGRDTLASFAGGASSSYRGGGLDTSYFCPNTTGFPYDLTSLSWFPGSQAATYARNTIERVYERVVNTWQVPAGSTNSLNPYKKVPHGRLGCPNLDSTTISEDSLLSYLGTSSIYNRAVTKGLEAETKNQLQSVHVLSQTVSYTVSGGDGMTSWANSMAYEWSKRMGMTNVYKVDFGSYTQIASTGNYLPAGNKGITATQAIIPVVTTTNFASTGVVRIEGRPVTYLTAAVTSGSTTCQIFDPNGLVLGDGSTSYTSGGVTTYLKLLFADANGVWSTTGIEYQSITTSSPYTVTLRSPIPQSYSTGTAVAPVNDGYIATYMNVRYSSIDNTTTPPTLRGCQWADTDATLRTGNYSNQNSNYWNTTAAYIGNTNPNKMYTSAIISSTVRPIDPPAKNKTYYIQNYGIPHLDADIPPIFALPLGICMNNLPQYATIMQNRYADGAWGCIWTSSSFLNGRSILKNGGSAVIMSHAEPYANGITVPHELFILLSYYNKMSLMEANFHTFAGKPGNTVYGDPLYRPYLSSPVGQRNISINPYGL